MHIGIRTAFANGTRIVFHCFIGHGHVILHGTVSLFIGISVMGPFCDHGIDQHILHELVLVESIDGNVSEECRFA